VASEFPDVEVRLAACLLADGLEFNFFTAQIWVAGVDKVLTPDGLISPGLGDTVSTPNRLLNAMC
jgi:uracil phosphoribosyltransferase